MKIDRFMVKQNNKYPRPRTMNNLNVNIPNVVMAKARLKAYSLHLHLKEYIAKIIENDTKNIKIEVNTTGGKI